MLRGRKFIQFRRDKGGKSVFSASKSLVVKSSTFNIRMLFKKRIVSV